MGRGRVVVMLHGLGRTRFSMSLLGMRLRSRGLDVINFGYSSLRRPISEHAKRLRDFIEQRVAEGARIDFVTHSLGSIVVRAFAADFHREFELGRVVMLGPPNQGSALARKLSRVPLVSEILGPSFRELREFKIPPSTNHLEVGIIAGGAGCERGLAPLVSGDNDGIVAVSETRLEGARDHCMVRGLHSFLMYYREVEGEAFHFLEHGRFSKGKVSGDEG